MTPWLTVAPTGPPQSTLVRLLAATRGRGPGRILLYLRHSSTERARGTARTMESSDRLQAVDVRIDEPADDKERRDQASSENRTTNCSRVAPTNDKADTDDEYGNNQPPVRRYCFTNWDNSVCYTDHHGAEPITC